MTIFRFDNLILFAKKYIKADNNTKGIRIVIKDVDTFLIFSTLEKGYKNKVKNSETFGFDNERNNISIIRTNISIKNIGFKILKNTKRTFRIAKQ